VVLRSKSGKTKATHLVLLSLLLKILAYVQVIFHYSSAEDEDLAQWEPCVEHDNVLTPGRVASRSAVVALTDPIDVQQLCLTTGRPAI
jgi:hypothetical protein